MWTTCRPKTIQEQAEAIESEGYSWPACNKQPPRIDRRRCRQQAPPSTSFLVNTIDLPWRNFFKSGVCCKISREKHPYFRRYSNFLTTQCGIGGRKLPRQNQLDSSCCFDTLLACGGQTDGQTDRHATTAYEWITHSRLTVLFPGLPRWAGTRKVKTNLDFTEARDSEWQWHQLGHMQVCTLHQTDSHTSTPLLEWINEWIFYSST